MFPLKSPWTYQLKRTRPLYTLETDLESDVCVIGGGISGVITAYYVLKYTDKKIILIDSYQVGHGATGHNAGQLVAELERSITSLVGEYGLEHTMEALRSVDSAWIMLEEVMRDTNLSLPYSTFVGYDVYTTKQQIHRQLADLALAHEGGLHNRRMYISEDHIKDLEIPGKYAPYYEKVPHASILSLAETINPQYIAAYPLRKGCLNSAVFTEQLLSFLVDTYGIERLQVYEQSPVTELDLHKDSAVIKTEQGKTVNVKKIILCTNGFEHFTIKDRHNDIDMNFHKNVKGNIGYMMATTEEVGKNPSATAYLEKDFDTDTGHANSDRDIVYSNEYVYTTRRPYDLGEEKPKNLFCIGGKGLPMEDTTTYNRNVEYSKDIKDEYVNFMHQNFDGQEQIIDQKEFMWHGLMGYTENGLRMVGFEPKNHTLMYNLGCNGIGIMPAIWGGKRIASLLNGDKSKSLFDPK